MVQNHAKTQADRSSDLDLAGISQSVENVRRQPFRVGLRDLRWLYVGFFVRKWTEKCAAFADVGSDKNEG